MTFEASNSDKSKAIQSSMPHLLLRYFFFWRVLAIMLKVSFSVLECFSRLCYLAEETTGGDRTLSEREPQELGRTKLRKLITTPKATVSGFM